MDEHASGSSGSLAHDPDPLDVALDKVSPGMIAAHRRNRTPPKTPQWPSAAPFLALLDVWAPRESSLGFVHRACILILLHHGCTRRQVLATRNVSLGMCYPL